MLLRTLRRRRAGSGSGGYAVAKAPASLACGRALPWRRAAQSRPGGRRPPSARWRAASGTGGPT
eukprot:3513103-Alexandrium_andersonii.AAC.1